MLTLSEALEITGVATGSTVDLAQAVLPAASFKAPGPRSLATLLMRASWWQQEIPIYADLRPDGTPLGGWCKLVIKGNGDWHYEVYIENLRGLPSYNFSVTAILTSPASRLAFSAQLSDHVGGQVEGGLRSSYRVDQGTNGSLRDFWDSLQDVGMTVHITPEENGPIGFLKEVAVGFLAYFVAFLTINPQVAAVILLSGELVEHAPVTFKPTLLAGVAIGGAVLLIGGPGYLLYAVVAGAATAESFRSEKLSPEAQAIATSVFKHTLDFDRIYLTNLEAATDPGTAKCIPVGTDIWINFGERFFDPIGSIANQGTLIHELVHAWQIINNTFDVDDMSDFVLNQLPLGTNPYDFPEDGSTPWSDLNIEGQADAVRSWFVAAQATGGTDSVPAQSSPLFHYIRDHIRTGQG